MATLAHAGNTLNPAIDCLIQDGWHVYSESYIEDGDESDSNAWFAQRKENERTIELAADDPVTLLGLSVIWNRWGDGWRKADIPFHFDALPHFEVVINNETDEVTRKRVD